jgi:uncharacterized protein YodC (DUF2158 family)
MAIQVGDVVRLKSSPRPLMVVTMIPTDKTPTFNGQISVVWITPSGEAATFSFPEACLKVEHAKESSD